MFIWDEERWFKFTKNKARRQSLLSAPGQLQWSHLNWQSIPTSREKSKHGWAVLCTVNRLHILPMVLTLIGFTHEKHRKTGVVCYLYFDKETLPEDQKQS